MHSTHYLALVVCSWNQVPYLVPKFITQFQIWVLNTRFSTITGQKHKIVSSLARICIDLSASDSIQYSLSTGCPKYLTLKFLVVVDEMLSGDLFIGTPCRPVNLLLKQDDCPTTPVATFDTATLEMSDACAVKGLPGIGCSKHDISTLYSPSYRTINTHSWSLPYITLLAKKRTMIYRFSALFSQPYSSSAYLEVLMYCG